MAKKQTYWKYRPQGEGAWSMVDRIPEDVFLDADDPKQIWEIAAVKLTPKEFDSLPEFEGW